MVSKLMEWPLLTSILAGSLLGIGFIIPSLWWLCIAGIILQLQVIITKTLRQACLLSYLIWSIKAAYALLWFWSGYPLDWVAIPSLPAQIGVIGFYWLTSALWLGSGGVLLAVITRYVYCTANLPRIIFYVTLPFTWLLSELVAAGVFSLLTLGPGSFIQSYFSFGQIGYLLGETQLGLYIAGWWGVSGLTLTLVFIGTLFWYLLIPQLYKILLIVTVVEVSLVGMFSVWYHPWYQSSNVTVQSINTKFSTEMLGQPGGLEEKTAVLEQALTKALAQPTDFILLPEDSRYFSSVFGDVSPRALVSQFEFTHGSTSAIVIDSSRLDLASGQTVLRAQMYDGSKKKLYQFDKQYLVPQGEYVPYLYGSTMRLLGFGAAVDSIALDSSYRPGQLLQSDTMPTNLPGVLFCFESVRPDGVISLQKNRTLPFVAHPISHGWFHAPYQLWHQLDVMLIVQARSSGVPIVSAGNMTTGKLYLPNGVIDQGEVITVSNKFNITQFKF